MRVVWDPRKAMANLRKHGISLSDAEGAIFDPMGLTREDEDSQGERRFVTIARDHLDRVVVVVHSHRGEVTRLISARRATRKERLQYAKTVRF